MKSAKTTPNQHLIINNVKLTTSKDKEEAFREVWKEALKITPEENATCDIYTKNEVIEYSE